MSFRSFVLTALLLGPSLLLARQSQDFYLVIESLPLQLIQIQPYDIDIQASEQQNTSNAPFAIYSFSSNQPDQILSAALGNQPPEGIKIYMKAEAPEGANSQDWVELALGMKPLVRQIPAGFGQGFKIYLKAEAGQSADAFDITQMQIRYRFDRF